MKYYVTDALKKFNLIWYFKKDLKFLVKAKIEAYIKEYENWDELVEKTITAKTKSSFWSFSFIKKIY